MAYRLLANGAIECDTVEEIRALAAAGSKPARREPADAEVAAPKRKRRRRRNKKAKLAGNDPAPRKNPKLSAAWDAARKLAKREGISVTDARQKLAAAKS